MKKGQTVTVYQMPHTQEGFEGDAVLVKKELNNKNGECEYWRVKFANGDEVCRWVK